MDAVINSKDAVCVTGSVALVGAARSCGLRLTAIPEKSLFAREGEAERPTASVLVKLRAGRTLSPGQVEALESLLSRGRRALRAALADLAES